jgi:hypothetical protein
MPPAGNLHNVLCAAAERVTLNMKSQAVVMTVWALATLDMSPVGSLRDTLWSAPERVAPSITNFVSAHTVMTTARSFMVGASPSMGAKSVRSAKPAALPEPEVFYLFVGSRHPTPVRIAWPTPTPEST